MGRFIDAPGQNFRHNCLKCLAFTQKYLGGLGIALESIVLFLMLRQKIAIGSVNFTPVRVERYEIFIFFFGCETQ